MPTPTTLEIEFGGRTLTLETGKLAGLAGGAVTLRYGDSMVLGTANRSEPRPGLDFFPLTVDFEERMYAAGKIPGGFIKREGRASEAATLAARLTDRPIRPLFPEGYKDDVQLVISGSGCEWLSWISSTFHTHERLPTACSRSDRSAVSGSTVVTPTG